MGVAPTGDIFRGFVFDNENSKDFGVYITGEAVYNAPERDMEMISIPGRNGSFALDNGRWENIEVTYSAGIAGDSQTDFAEAISDLRNMLVSKTTYCRLTDDYNPGEYRMALYKSGLDVTPELARGGTFDIVFECKPQRFLTDGDTPITVASGDVLTNPTRFDASPLLAVTGHGSVTINDDTVEVLNSPAGWQYDVPITKNVSWSTDYPCDGTRIPLCTVTSPTVIGNDGDTIRLTWSHLRLWIDPPVSYNNITAGDTSTSIGSIIAMSPPRTGSPGFVTLQPDPFEARIGTSTAIGGTAQMNFYASTGSSTIGGAFYADIFVGFDADTNQFYCTVEASSPSSGFGTMTRAWTSVNMQVDIDSTKHSLGQPVYIDTEIGEAYVVSNGETISANSIVKMGDTLPTLKPGANEVTHDVAALQLTPRWWKL